MYRLLTGTSVCLTWGRYVDPRPVALDWYILTPLVRKWQAQGKGIRIPQATSPGMASHAENRSPLRTPEMADCLARIAWADDIIFVALSAQEMEDIIREVTTLLRRHDLPCVLKKTSLWAALGSVEIRFERATVSSEASIRVLGLRLGAAGPGERIQSAWKAFWAEKRWLLSRSLRLRVRWARWKQRVIPVLAFGASHSKWSAELVQKLTSETTGMARLMLHLCE